MQVLLLMLCMIIFLLVIKMNLIDEGLLNFSLSVYKTLYEYANSVPEKFARMFPYMKKDNWLYNYRTLNGIEKSFAGLARRAKYLETSNAAFECFKNNYDALKQCYYAFFPDVKNLLTNNYIIIKNLCYILIRKFFRI